MSQVDMQRTGGLEMPPLFFNRGASSTPVIVCAYNEELDLPSTLQSLARNPNVMPVVIDNGSSDATPEIAQASGAITLYEETPHQLRAFQAGLTFIKSEFKSPQYILCTDADTLVGKRWAEALTGTLQEQDSTPGGIIFGPVHIVGGISRATDILRTTVLNGRQLASMALGRAPGARGANIGLDLGHDNEIVDEILSIDTDSTELEADVELKKAVLRAEGYAKATLKPQALVHTQGDRYSSITEYARAIQARFHA